MEQEYQPEIEQIQPEQIENTPVYAGFWTRFVAVFIDSIIVGVGNLLISLLIDGSFWETSLLTNLMSIVISWLYYSLQESGTRQATLGKHIMDIKVTDTNGQRISFLRATGRYFSKFISAIILCIGYIMAAFDSKHQALHDKMAETLVVSSK